MDLLFNAANPCKCLIKKLGLADGLELMDGINKAIETYRKSERNKYRSVVYYVLAKHFEKESAYRAPWKKCT